MLWLRWVLPFVSRNSCCCTAATALDSPQLGAWRSAPCAWTSSCVCARGHARWGRSSLCSGLQAEQRVLAPAASTSPSHPALMPWGKPLPALQPSGASPAWEVYTEPTPRRKINPRVFLLSCVCLLVLAGRTHAQKASAPCSPRLLARGRGFHSLRGSAAALLLAPERIGRSLPGTQPTEPHPRPQEGADQLGAVPA